MAWEDQSEADMDEHLGNLIAILSAGNDNHQAWHDILVVAERRSKRTEKAQELIIRSAEMIGRAELLVVFGRIVNVIKEEARGTLQETILERLDSEVLGRIAPEERQEELARKGRVLPGVSGEGTGVREGDPGGEALGGPAIDIRATVPARKGDGEDEPRDREDQDGSVDRPDVPDDPQGLSSGDDGSDRSPSEEPAVGGDRATARKRKRRPTG